MAPPAKAAQVKPPDTLPGDFFDKQGTPETLPANFDFGNQTQSHKLFGGNKPVATEEPKTLTGIRPHQSDTPAHAVEDVLGNIGGGGLGALETMGRISPWGAAADKLMGKPTIYEEGYNAIKHPGLIANAIGEGVGNAARHPLETIEGSIGAAGATGPLMHELLPSRARAIRTLTGIENEAKDVPLSLNNTSPAVEGFRKYVSTGGMPARVMGKLGPRVEEAGAPGGEPLKFPEARDFYTSASRSTTRPNTLKRLLEPPEKPQQRMELGNVREALNKDLTEAAEQVGKGKQYQQGLTEYGRAAQGNKLLKKAGYGAGAAVGAEALRRMGILGGAVKHIPGGGQ